MNEIKKTNIWLWIALCYTIISGCFFMYIPMGYKPILCELGIIVWGGCLGLSTDEKPFSINKIFWVFNLVFFGFMPTIQVYIGAFPWFQHFSAATCNKANLIILFSFAVYYLCRKLTGNWSLRKNKPSHIQAAAPSLYHYQRIGLAVFIICGISIIYVYGIKHLWTRLAMMEAEVQLDSTRQLLFDKLVRGCMLYYMLLTTWLYRQKKISFNWFLGVLVFCVFTNFPAAIPRYLTATLYGGLLICLAPAFLRGKNTFALALVILLVTAFPLAGITRHTSDVMQQRFNHPKTFLKETFSYGEYDAYATLCRTIEYIADKGTTKGEQLLGVLLFFVPRNIWPNKPVGSGMLIYKDHFALGATFRNIASPFYSEGLINFGFAGCLLFVAFFAVATSLYDRFYWNSSRDMAVSYPLLFYPIAVMMSFFMMRGDMLSSFAFSVGFFMAGLAYHILLCKLPESKKQG